MVVVMDGDSHLPGARETARLLGMQITMGRKERRWTQRELADRANITPETLRKIERGDMSVSVGAVLDVADLAGVPLFTDDRDQLRTMMHATAGRIALLPTAVRARRDRLDSDF
jgi:transcriptional regulator with XRE-family HTH domain